VLLISILLFSSTQCLSSLNQAYSYILVNNISSVYSNLYNTYFGSSSSLPTCNVNAWISKPYSSDLQNVINTKTLRVGISISPPFWFPTNYTGFLGSVTTIFANSLGQMLGVSLKVQYVVPTLSSNYFQNYVLAFQQNMVDIVIDGTSYTTDRAQSLDFSTCSDISYNVIAITLKSSGITTLSAINSSNTTIAVRVGTINYPVAQSYLQAKILNVSNVTEAINALNSNQANVYIDIDSDLLYYLNFEGASSNTTNLGVVSMGYNDGALTSPNATVVSGSSNGGSTTTSPGSKSSSDSIVLLVSYLVLCGLLLI